MKNLSLINENKDKSQLPLKYKKANEKFEALIKNHPDFSKMEPIEIYRWVENLIKLTKV